MADCLRLRVLLDHFHFDCKSFPQVCTYAATAMFDVCSSSPLTCSAVQFSHVTLEPLETHLIEIDTTWYEAVDIVRTLLRACEHTNNTCVQGCAKQQRLQSDCCLQGSL